MTIHLTQADPAKVTQTIQIGQHVVIADMALADGGADEGPDPHDLYDAALGACKALTILWYAKREGLPVEQVSTSITRDNSQERKGIYRLQATIAIGGDLSDAQLDKLTAIAEKCPVQRLMTSVVTEISTTVERLV